MTTKPASKAVATIPETKDDLTKINGIGPGLAKKLNAHGITSFQQIARWKKTDMAHFDELLSFKGRIARDNWIGQAKTLQRDLQLRAAASKLKSKTAKSRTGSKGKSSKSR